MSTSEAVLRQATGSLTVERGRRVVRKVLRDPTAMAGIAVIVLVAGACILAPVIARSDPIATDFSNRLRSPSLAHPLGTDNVGRDVLARLLYGGRLSLGMAVSATAGITLVGLVLGLVAATYGRLAGGLIMRVVDVLLAMPTLILALVIVGLLGQGLRNLIITIILVQWPRYARLVRGMALRVREQEFVEAARAVGASRGRIMVRHLAPNLIGPVAVFSTIDMGNTLLVVSSLSFLGFGVGPPTPEWGAMLAEARHLIDRAPMLLVLPGAAITGLVLAFNLAGDGLRDLLDPRTVESMPGWERRRLTRRRLSLRALGLRRQAADPEAAVDLPAVERAEPSPHR